MSDRLTGYILHTKNDKESGLQLEVFTQQQGRQRLYWRHAKSKFAKRGLGQLEFCLVEFQVQQRKHNLFVNQVDKLSSHQPKLTGKTLLCGLYLNELICKLCVIGQGEQPLFSAYQLALDQLSGESNNLELTLRHFELSLLQDLGYAHQLHSDTSGNDIVTTAQYLYDPEKGFMQSQGGNLSGEILLDIAKGTIACNLAAVKYINRRLITKLNNYQPLASRKLFQQLYE